MKNSKLRRALLLLASAVLLVSLSVGATLAYLTSEDEVVNTFTVGKVEINLDEEKVDLYGKSEGTRTEIGNEYKLMPGHTYTKDPTVTVIADSEESYIRMIVKINELADLKVAFPDTKYWDGDVILLQEFVTWNSDKWECVEATADVAGDTATYIFNYYTTVSTVDAAAKKLEPLFDSFTIPGEAENEALLNLEDLQIDITAYAIQADGFNNAEAAWAEFK